jgi:hypothetical protein
MPPRTPTLLRIPSESVLAILPERVTTFLRAATFNADAQAALAVGGYTDAHHEDGMRLLTAVLAPRKAGPSALDDEPARAAEAEIQCWVRTHFSRLRMALARLRGEEHPLFLGIEVPEGNEAVLALATLLDRLNQLSPADADVSTLAGRGLNGELRHRLRALVERARAISPYDIGPEDSREAELIALYRWHADWAGTARSLIRNKNVLAALGVARKRRRTTAVVDDIEDTG